MLNRLKPEIVHENMMVFSFTFTLAVSNVFAINDECLLMPSDSSCEKPLNWLGVSFIPKLICSAIAFMLNACERCKAW